MRTSTAKREKEIEEPKPVPVDNQIEKEILKRAFKEIGGIPKNYSFSKVHQIHSKAYRINIYTEVDSENFVKQNRIAHSLFLRLDEPLTVKK